MDHKQQRFDPYDMNGGTCVAIAGADYCVVAADTRMSTGYSILTREYSKLCKLADKCVMASGGFQADVKALQKALFAKHLIYQHQHGKQVSCPAMGQLLSNTLYYKRFFPYYAFNVLGGLDNEGKGCVYTYDAVGSYERVGYSAQGSGSTLIMPVLDNQLKSPSPLLLPAVDAVTPLSETEAIDLVKDVFASATERDIYTKQRIQALYKKMAACLATGNPLSIEKQKEHIDLVQNLDNRAYASMFMDKKKPTFKSKRGHTSTSGSVQDDVPGDDTRTGGRGAGGRAKRGRGGRGNE